MDETVVCDRCGQHPARYFPVTLLGALMLSSHHVCVACYATEDAIAEQTPPPDADDVAHLGPIQFDVLFASLLHAESMEPPEDLPGYDLLVRQVAQAHGQQIPTEVEAVFARWRERS